MPILKRGKSLGASYANQGLGPTLKRIFTGTETVVDNSGFTVPSLMDLDELSFKILLIATALFFLSLFIYALWKRRRIFPDFSGISMSFLLCHILSPVTWKHHLVSLLLVYSFVPLVAMEKKSTLYYFLLGLVIFTGLLGGSLIGMKLQRILGAYGVFLWPMVIVYFSLFLSPSRICRSTAPQ